MKKQKEEKLKVGRPKLADQEILKNSKSMIISAFVLLLVLVVGGIYSLTNFNTSKLQGSVCYSWDAVKYENQYKCASGYSENSSGKCIKIVSKTWVARKEGCKNGTITSTKTENGSIKYLCQVSETRSKDIYKVPKCTNGGTYNSTKGCSYTCSNDKDKDKGNGNKKTSTTKSASKSNNSSNSSSSSSSKNTTKKVTTTTTRAYSTNPATTGTVTSKNTLTYSIVASGGEPNTCAILILETKGKEFQYEVICKANARPIKVTLRNGNKEKTILHNFNNHKGYVRVHKYTSSEKIDKDTSIKLYYKKSLRSGDNDESTYSKVAYFYKNDKLVKNDKVDISNSKLNPKSKCTVSVSDVKAYSFKWEIKCEEGAKPLSLRLVYATNGRMGTNVGLSGGFNNNYGITKSEVVSNDILNGMDYRLDLYYGTKEKDYYKTTVRFTTPVKDVATTKPGTPKTTSSTAKTTTTTEATTTTKAESKCRIASMGSKKGSRELKYKVECTGDAKILTSKYKVDNGQFETRDKDKMKDMSSTIVFKESRIGHNITLRVYYTNTKYSEGTVKLGAGTTAKGN